MRFGMMALAIAMGAGLAAAMPGSALHAQTPRDTVVMAKAIDDIISMDPAESFEFSGSEAIGNVYNKLLTFNPKNVAEIRGELAQSWSVADDGKTYTFKMRPNVKFHSGNPVTAADAAYSLQRAVILNKSPGFILTQFGFNKDNAKDKIKATAPDTLVIETDRAVAPTFFYYCLTAVVGSIVDSKTVIANEKGGDFGNDWLKTNSAASGPYRLRSWRANEGYTLEANEQYWGGAPKNKRVVVRHVKEAASQRLLLEKGDADYARNLTKDQLDALASNTAIKTDKGLKGAIVYASVNQKNPILAKPEVREALKWLTDYDAIQKNIVSATHSTHQSFLPIGFLGAIEDRPYKFDLAKGKELLAKAGYPNGFSVTMDVRTTYPAQDIAQAIQANWAQAGIKLDLIPGDGRQTLTKYRARNHDIYIGQWGPDYQDPHTNAETFAMNVDNTDDAKSKTLAWRNAWDIPDMTKRTAAAVTERDAKKREQIYQELQREHQKTSPFIILFQETEVVARRANVDGFVIGPSFDNNYYAGIAKN
jgi:peptide/nickel transport system substrate-binding protein